VFSGTLNPTVYSLHFTVLSAVVLTQYRRVKDGRTDGRNCHSYSTALAMRALRRAVKTGVATLPPCLVIGDDLAVFFVPGDLDF